MRAPRQVGTATLAKARYRAALTGDKGNRMSEPTGCDEPSSASAYINSRLDREPTHLMPWPSPGRPGELPVRAQVGSFIHGLGDRPFTASRSMTSM